MSETPAPSNSCRASCEVPQPDGLYLCQTHVDLLNVDLDSVPGVVDDLEITITRQNRTVSERHGSRSSTRPLPWNEHAAVKASNLSAALNRAAIDVAGLEQDERDPLSDVALYDTANLARWLRRNASTVRRHDRAGDIYAQVCDAVTEARRAVDKPVDPSPFGVCGAEDEEGNACEQYLYAPRGRAWITCRCGARHSAQERMDWMLSRCQNLNGPASRIASWLLMFGINTTADGVRGMARRDQIKPIDPDAEPHRFRLVDAVTAYTRSRSRAARQDAAA